MGQQVLAALKGYKLHEFVYGTQLVPTNRTLDFEAYELQDQLLVSWHLSLVEFVLNL